MGSSTVPPGTPTGKTLGDVIDAILTNPKKGLALMMLLAGLSGLIILVTLAFTRLFGVETQEVRFGSADSHIVFEKIEKRSGNEEFIVIVNPEGWQKSAIELRQGDHISFYANGKICIDLHEIVDKVNLRLKYEDEWATKKSIKRDDSSETQVPEDYFTPAERKSLILHRPWVDPGGFDLATYEPSFRSRRNRYLLPNEKAAGLVAAIKSDTGDLPARSEAFFVGRSLADFSATRAGYLWFTVNDVQCNDPNNPNLFYNDNIGSFWVRVVVKRA